MFLIVLEAMGALLLLLLIVWWTMFSGRKKGEPPEQVSVPDETRRSIAEGFAPVEKKPGDKSPEN